MFKMLFDDISPQKNHHVDEVVASHCCGAEGQVLALDMLHFQVQQNITCNQNIRKLFKIDEMISRFKTFCYLLSLVEPPKERKEVL